MSSTQTITYRPPMSLAGIQQPKTESQKPIYKDYCKQVAALTAKADVIITDCLIREHYAKGLTVEESAKRFIDFWNEADLLDQHFK